jgi:hypothetical protein
MDVKSSKKLGIIRIDISAENALTGGLFLRTPKEGKIMSKSTLKILPALVVAITALVAQPVFGNTLLVFTEESSTLLTATVGGNPFGTVTFTSLDQWTWSNPDRPSVEAIFMGGATFWLEPGSLTLANVVNANIVGTVGVFTIASDFDSAIFGNPKVSDSTVVSNFATFDYLGGGSETFDVQFIDKGDVAAAPDTGSTLGLLSLSVVALLGATRLRFLQLAA